MVAIDIELGHLRIDNRSTTVAAVADDLHCDALGDGADRPRIDAYREVRMTVNVNKAGGHGQARRVQHRPFRSQRKNPQVCDSAALDENVAADRRAARTVHYGSTADYQVTIHWL